jgi:hypothetical protein
MKEFYCNENFYIEDIAFALKGDTVIILPDGKTVVNKRTQAVTNAPDILWQNVPKYFTLVADHTKEDRVNHPSHYTWLKDLCGIEVIDVTRHMGFSLGNVIKYVLRAGYKTEEGISNLQKEIEDLEKAEFYLKDRINQLKQKLLN